MNNNPNESGNDCWNNDMGPNRFGEGIGGKKIYFSHA